MPNITLRLTNQLHDKVRELAFKERTSIQKIVIDLLEKRVANGDSKKKTD